MMEGSEVVHEDGRKCTYRNGWVFDMPPDGIMTMRQACERDHPYTGVVNKEYVDRGEFGMPGLGTMAEGIIDAGWMTKMEQSTMPEVTLWPTLKILQNELVVDYGEQGYSVAIATDDAKYVMQILPDILTTFLEKNQKYALVEQGYDLGDVGIIPDLNRKLGILVARLWQGAEEVGESTDEVIGDMIGHLLLMLAKRRD